MIQPLNQPQMTLYEQGGTGATQRLAAGLYGAERAQGIKMGLGPEEIVTGVSGAKGNGAGAVGRDGGRKPDYDTYECQTCKNRKYKDGSNDPGVSFKTATRVSPEKAAAAVRSHEMEHVTRERAKAEREGREVVSQNVTYRTGICPECGRTYVSGGTTTTVTKGQVEGTYGLGDEEKKGRYLDVAA